MGKSNKKSYGQIARDTGLSVSFISRVFRGERGVSTSSLVAIAKSLGITTDRLVRKLKRIRKERTSNGNEEESTKGKVKRQR